MVLPPPSVLPKWADQDIIDPISNQNNVTTPPVTEQNLGWGFKEFPPRQWFNWLGRYTYRWLAYLKQNDSKSTVKVIQGTYGVPVQIADTTVPGRLLLLWIQDSSQSNASDRFSGMCIPYSSSASNRTVYALGTSLNITVSTINNGTGNITVSTAGAGTDFTMVVQQFLAS